MNEYGDFDVDPAPDQPDPRIVAMHRVVDLEQQQQRAQMEADRAQKTAAVVSDELRGARDDLYRLLGFSDDSEQQAKRQLKEELAKAYAAKERLR